MPLIGHARVSTEDQVTDAQTDVLKAAGRVEIFREHMSGAKASRPELAKALARERRGDVLVVAGLRRSEIVGLDRSPNQSEDWTGWIEIFAGAEASTAGTNVYAAEQ